MEKSGKKRIFRTVLITILCTVINVLGRAFAVQADLPLWLDTLGTCYAVYFAGPLSGAIAGVAGNIILGTINDLSLAYALTSAAVAAAMSFCVRKGYMESLTKAAISSFWIGMLSVLISAPLNLIINNGYSGNRWGDALFDMLDWHGMPKIVCAFAGEAMVDVVDKQVCIIAAYLVIRFLKSKKIGKCYLEKAAALFMAAAVAAGAAGSLGMSVSAENSAIDEASDGSYLSTVFNNRSGMMSSEANVIAQTDDGCIWIGSYAGLTRYNGREFEFISESGIANVTNLLNDSKGRLWIATNDSGIARYENGVFTFFTTAEGLPSDSVRSLTEAADGTVYLGTSDKLCSFSTEDVITVYECDVRNVSSMETVGDTLICTDFTGDLHIIRNGEKQQSLLFEDTGIFCYFVKQTTHGLLVGTSDDTLYSINLGTSEAAYEPYAGGVPEDVSGIAEDSSGRIWICAESAFGFIDENGIFEQQYCEGFDYSFEWICQDYQGNIWLASSRYGVLKLSLSSFVNLFDAAGEKNVVVNGAAYFDDDIYCAADNGLVIIDGESGKSIEKPITEMLEGDRVRSLVKDNAGNLWICTYGDDGLVRYSPSGETESFTAASKQTVSDRFRCAAVMPDGTVAAGTADGISFIKDNAVTGSITTEDGLKNSQILCLVCDENGTLYAGTDGGGIYRIEDKKIVKSFSTENGLTSDVILRMVHYNGGYFVVTGNSLCFMNGDKISPLKEFPYFNNYDVIIVNNTAYVLSSAGLFAADAGALAEGRKIEWKQLTADQGLLEGLTANSWSFADDRGYLYLCTNGGLVRFDTSDTAESVEYRFDIDSVECDGRKIAKGEDGYLLPSVSKRITLRASVKNYTLTDVKVRFFVDGMNEDAEAVSYKELEPLQITEPGHGTYNVHMQIMDSSGQKVIRERICRLYKEVQFWETPAYKIYLMIVVCEMIAFATWTVIVMINISRKKGELEQLRAELEAKVSDQMNEIAHERDRAEKLFHSTVVALSETVDAKDRYTSGHSRRVAEYSKMLAQRMGKSADEQERIYFAGLLHDVGKIRIPEDIINKPGKLTDSEFETIKIHTVTGYRILKNIPEYTEIAIGAKFHHERYDGRGYPTGIEGENIPEIARIIGVADAYDAMTSNRSYRSALPQHVVRDEIEKGKGRQFDPQIADIMLEMMDNDTDYKLKQAEELDRIILAVDDDPVNIELINVLLKDEPLYTVVSALNCDDAVLTLKRRKDIDLVLLDLEMPEKDGFETLEQIRAFSQIPVVLMTSNRDSETIKTANSMAVGDYLTKPILPMALKEILHSILERI